MADDLNQQIGRLEAQVENLHRDMTELKADVKAISASVNRWKGAGALLMIIGTVFGYMVDSIIGLVSK